MAKRRRRRRRHRRNPMANGAKATIALGALTLFGSGIYALYDRQHKKAKGCGARYHHLAVTVSGAGFDEGYGLWGTSQDLSEWKDLAERLSELAISHFVELGRVECEVNGGAECSDPEKAWSPTWDRYNAILPQKNALQKKVDDLDSVWFTLDIPMAVSRSKSVITDALCVLERSDDAIKAYGRVPPVVADPAAHHKKKLPFYAWTALGGAGLVAAGLVVGQVVQAPGSASTTVVVDRGPTRKAAQDWVR